MANVGEQLPSKIIKLRYSGICRLCAAPLPAGSNAIHERATKTVRCLQCPPAKTADSRPQPPEDLGESIDAWETAQQPHDDQTLREVEPGQPGASARREHERRRAQREAETRAKHPRIGELIAALQSDPHSTTAWAKGAEGEEKFGARLNAIASDSIRVLHDRRIPKTRANIDHIVVCPSGVFVIDAKKYTGRPHLRIQGGILRPRTETLMVGTRNCTKLVDGVLRQVALVRSALDANPIWAEIPVRGMLCFVDADWPLIGGSFTTRTVEAVWQKRAVAHIEKPGPLSQKDIVAIHGFLATAFPPA